MSAAVERFRASMVSTRGRWHDGIGYDLEILKSATPADRAAIEELLLARGVDDWRDVEAFAAIGSPRANEKLRAALESSDHRVRAAVIRRVPALVSDAERTAALVAALEGSEIYGGLTQALLEIEEFHPPALVEALLRGVLDRSGENAVHFAAMLMFVHGKAASAFDWDQRPFFLRFNTDDRAARVAAFRELCGKIGVDAGRYLGAARGK